MITRILAKLIGEVVTIYLPSSTERLCWTDYLFFLRYSKNFTVYNTEFDPSDVDEISIQKDEIAIYLKEE